MPEEGPVKSQQTEQCLTDNKEPDMSKEKKQNKKIFLQKKIKNWFPCFSTARVPIL